MSHASDTELRDLLLRRLAPERAAALEELLLVEDDCAERLLEIEHDLLDDYAAGRLDAPDRAAVARLLQDDPGAAARLRFAHALRRVAAQAAADDRSGGDPGSGTAAAGAATGAAVAGAVTGGVAPASGDPRPAMRTPGRLPRWLGPAGVLLAAALAIVMVLPPQLLRSPRAPAPPADGVADTPDVAPPAPAAPVTTGDAPAGAAAPAGTAGPPVDAATSVPAVLLRAERERAMQARVLELGGVAPVLRLQLELPDAGTAAMVSVRDARGRMTFESARLPAFDVGPYRVVEVELPRDALANGPASVLLQRPPAADGAPGEALFEWRVQLRSP